MTVTGKDKDGNTPQSKAGDYVSGRAATEDQLKKISDTIKLNAETAAGQHTEITVNDKKAPTIVPSDKVGTTDYGDYVGGNDNLLIAAKKDTKSGKTIYNIKLNDQLVIGQKGEQGEPGKPGTPGKDGKLPSKPRAVRPLSSAMMARMATMAKMASLSPGRRVRTVKTVMPVFLSPVRMARTASMARLSSVLRAKTASRGKDAVSISGQNGEGISASPVLPARIASTPVPTSM